jgi:hypothetical protein
MFLRNVGKLLLRTKSHRLRNLSYSLKAVDHVSHPRTTGNLIFPNISFKILPSNKSYIHDIQNTRRQDQMIDLHPHTASTHIRNDYASLDTYVDK